MAGLTSPPLRWGQSKGGRGVAVTDSLAYPSSAKGALPRRAGANLTLTSLWLGRSRCGDDVAGLNWPRRSRLGASNLHSLILVKTTPFSVCTHVGGGLEDISILDLTIE